RVPNTSRNFLDLVGRGFYDGLTFHRVETWCIQGGDPNGNGSGDFRDPQTGAPRYIPLEINRNLVHRRPGIVAMARNKNPNSASCQFYITKGAVPSLDGQYAIFGGVIDGLNTVMAVQPGDRILSARILPRNNESDSNSAGTAAADGGNQSQTNTQDPRQSQSNRSAGDRQTKTKTTTDSGF
ncbi:MAG TPA: peptidylprolyl isomerase, partial [Chroococcales cyanobacterium]